MKLIHRLGLIILLANCSHTHGHDQEYTSDTIKVLDRLTAAAAGASIQPPPSSDSSCSDEIPTLNNLGSQFSDTHFTQIFYAEARGQKKVLEIGPTWGRAVLNYIDDCKSVTLCDAEERHLQYIAAQIQQKAPNNLPKLNLWHGFYPASGLTGSYDLVLAEKVTHFYSPEQFKQFLDTTYTLLAPGGELYITNLSPRTETLYTYPMYCLKRWIYEFPGYFDINNHLQVAQYIVPPELLENPFLKRMLNCNGGKHLLFTHEELALHGKAHKFEVVMQGEQYKLIPGKITNVESYVILKKPQS